MAKSREEVVALLEGVVAELGPEWVYLADVLVGLVAVVRVGQEDDLDEFSLLFSLMLLELLEESGGYSLPAEAGQWHWN